MQLNRVVACLAVVTAMLISACSVMQTSDTVNNGFPPLPSITRLECCWQSEEQVVLTTGESENTLLAATSLTEGQLTVVVLDSIGRRLLTLRYDDNGLRELQAPPQWRTSNSRYLLAAIFLHHISSVNWLQHSPDWQVQFEGNSRVLSHRGREIMSLVYDKGEAPQDPRTVRVPGHQLTMRVTTLTRTEL